MSPNVSAALTRSHQLSVTGAQLRVTHSGFVETNLVSDGTIPARVTDPDLVNSWGIAASPTGPFWINDNHTGVVTLYDGNGNPVSTSAGLHAITIASPAGVTTSSPTGEVHNPFGHGFDISANGQTGSAEFIFATEDGTISGWNPNVDSANSVIAVDNSNGGHGAVYKGLAMGSAHGDNFLFAADFREGKVDVFNDHFDPVKSFTDPNVPDAYAPFNVQALDGHLFVTYAERNAAGTDDVKGIGHGFVDEFDFRGDLIKRIASHGPLDSPWGLAIAPHDFGRFAGDLLVGNFGNGRIHAYNIHSGHLEGTLRDQAGNPITIDGLWALMPGNHGPGSHPGSIYFTAGPDDETHGLFGTLSPDHPATAHQFDLMM